jgi:hypothetical protein
VIISGLNARGNRVVRIRFEKKANVEYGKESPDEQGMQYL